MNRGLIEADIASMSRTASLALPRFMNRGLIEARGGCVEHTHGVQYFPDS